MTDCIVNPVGSGLFTVESGDKRYTVNIDKEACTCKGYFYNKTCKHVRAVKRHIVKSYLKPKVKVCAFCRDKND